MFIRREVRSLEDETLKHYAIAVGKMKERPPEQPTSWWYQAAMHGIANAPKELPLYNQCIHGSWYFLPWHRMYLYYFERIVRAAVVEAGGPEDWALPYWNYGIDNAHASIPDLFREPRSEQNPLFVKDGDRSAGINAGGMLREEIRSDELALACEIYPGDKPRQLGGGTTHPRHRWGEFGQLEELPHNLVHDAIGEGGWMSFLEKAAKDPIFWLHHGNIDRIWAVWSLTHENPSDGNWLGQEFEFFDAGGEKVTLPCRDVLDTIGNLDYTYDVIPAEEGEAPAPTPGDGKESVFAGAADGDPKVVGASEEEVTLTGRPEAISVALENRAQQEVFEAARETDPRRVYLNIEDIEGERNPGTVYGVYLNLPEDPDEEALGEHYAGAVSFFGIEHTRKPPRDEHGHQLRYVLEVGDLLRSLGGVERFEQEGMQVTFRPLPLLAPEGESREAFSAAAAPEEDQPPVQIGRVSLAVDG